MNNLILVCNELGIRELSKIEAINIGIISHEYKYNRARFNKYEKKYNSKPEVRRKKIDYSAKWQKENKERVKIHRQNYYKKRFAFVRFWGGIKRKFGFN